MKIERIVYMTVMYELLEEKYGDTFIRMVNAVQDDITILCCDVPMDVAIICVNAKFNHPEISIKTLLLNEMKNNESDG